MTEREVRHNHAPVWGIFLLILGVVLLMQTFGVLPWSLWGTLWRFWPAILIVIGVSILLHRQSIWLVSLIVFIVLAGAVGIAVWQNSGSTGEVATSTFTQPGGSLQDADVSIDFSAGSLNIGSLSNTGNFVEAEAETRNNVPTMQANFQQQGNSGQLSMKTVNQQFWNNTGTTWRVNFTPSLPLTFNITANAANMILNLSQLNVTDFRLDINAGNCNLTVPATGTTTADIRGNAANIEITVPDGVAARIRTSVAVGSIEVDQNRFPRSGNFYQSSNYDSAANRIEMTLDANVGRIRVS